MSTDEEFGKAEFVLGSLFGERAWTVNDEGILISASYSHGNDWRTDGESVAECKVWRIPAKFQPENWEDLSWDERSKLSDEWRKNHDIADCSHGFYAYFSDQADGHYYISGETYILGVVEGYGDVMVGKKGFRSSKAKVLALSVQSRGAWDLNPRIIGLLEENYEVPVFRSDRLLRKRFPTTAVGQIEDLLVAADSSEDLP